MILGLSVFIRYGAWFNEHLIVMFDPFVIDPFGAEHDRTAAVQSDVIDTHVWL